MRRAERTFVGTAGVVLLSEERAPAQEAQTAAFEDAAATAAQEAPALEEDVVADEPVPEEPTPTVEEEPAPAHAE